MTFEKSMYDKNVADWLAQPKQEQTSVLNNSQNNQHFLDLSHIQKKKLKKNFYTPGSLEEHNQSICANLGMSGMSVQSPSHTCKDCLRSFKDINNYKEHRFQEHKVTEFPNIRQCKMCSYATLLKSKYDCHMRCHLNNKVIKCQRCTYSTINIRHMSKHERLHMINIKNKNESGNSGNGSSKQMHGQHGIRPKGKDITDSKTSPQASPSEVSSSNEYAVNRGTFSFYSSERKSSLTSNDGSHYSATGSSSPVSHVSTSSQSPPPELAAIKSITSTKTFHNILNLINDNNGSGSSSSSSGGESNSSGNDSSNSGGDLMVVSNESSKENNTASTIQQMNSVGLLQPAGLSSNFEESFRSNFENLIKFQFSSNLSASTFYSNLVNHHYQHNHQQLNNNPTGSNHFPHPYPSHQNFYPQQTLPPTTDDHCENTNCSHHSELVNLRENIFKLLHSLMPQFIQAMDTGNGNENNRDLIQIDKMVDTLVQQMNVQQT